MIHRRVKGREGEDGRSEEMKNHSHT